MPALASRPSMLCNRGSPATATEPGNWRLPTGQSLPKSSSAAARLPLTPVRTGEGPESLHLKEIGSVS